MEEKEPDFSGWATKAGLRCSDGRTIMPDAFKDQDKIQVPLVWSHGHKDPTNVLGHAILENRGQEGVYCYGFFNDTEKGKHSKQAVAHGDINSLSIWANDLVQKSGKVLHGAIREVSLVLSGANPGALITNVSVKHSDGDVEELEDEAIIYTGLTFEHAITDAEDKTLEHAEDDDDKSIQDVIDSMNEEQQQVLMYMVGEALESASGSIEQSGIDQTSNKSTVVEHAELPEDATVEDVINSMTDIQKKVLYFMVGEAAESAAEVEHSNLNQEEGSNMSGSRQRVFEQNGVAVTTKDVLSHDQMNDLIKTAKSSFGGSFRAALEDWAGDHLEHGIQDIEVLFPDAKTIGTGPELFARRTEWVNKLMSGVRKSPFARIKTISADITVQEARAKGYITGTLKKEEFFRVKSRVTTPQTIYKKQKLDRDDMIDITDFDVVAWLKGEMRVMLDEEVARAILVGDGRAAEAEDKISEDHIRPIAYDHELYTTRVNVNISDADSSIQEALDRIVLNRVSLRGTGLPTMFTTETYIARFLLLRDNTGRKLYKNLEEVASDLRVESIVPVEILNEYDEILCILVNPADYVVGADRGGQVSLFDDFDIDYNQYKYLIETRMSGALVKLKSAMVIMSVPAEAVEVVPAEPTFNAATGELTVTDTVGVVYRRGDTDAIITAAGGPYTFGPGTSVVVTAEPASANYFFASSNDDEWIYQVDEA